MRIKLVKGISYAGAVKATKKNPYVECDEKTAKALISAGYFEEADETVKTKSEPVFEETAKDPKEMTLSQLKAYAKEINIDTKGLKTKAEYLEAVTAKEEAEEMPWQW